MKHNMLKVSGFLALFIIAIACGGKKSDPVTPASTTNESTTKPEAETASTSTSGEGNKKGMLIFKQNCVICHGADGKLGVSGAKDLSISTLTLDESITQITNGKNLMTPYKDILSAEQIKAVAEYIVELRK